MQVSRFGNLSVIPSSRSSIIDRPSLIAAWSYLKPPAALTGPPTGTNRTVYPWPTWTGTGTCAGPCGRSAALTKSPGGARLCVCRRIQALVSLKNTIRSRDGTSQQTEQRPYDRVTIPRLSPFPLLSRPTSLLASSSFTTEEFVIRTYVRVSVL